MRFPWKKKKVETEIVSTNKSIDVGKINSKHVIRVSNLKIEYAALDLEILEYEQDKNLRGDRKGELDRLIRRMVEIKYEIGIREGLIGS